MVNRDIVQSGRRHFLKAAIAGGIGAACLNSRLSAMAASPPAELFTQMGINAPFGKAAGVAAAGADFLLLPVKWFLMPDWPEKDFEKRLKLLEASPIPVLSCNSFLTGGPLRSVGPEAKPENVLRFATTAFKRAKRAGVKRIILGSSKSRELPEGWSKAQADEQFIDLLKRMGDLAGAEGVVVAVENLQQKECNYLMHLEEVGEIVATVDHPHIRVLADLYHASVMQDAPESLAKYVSYIDMVEIAEAKGRTVPGVSGQDFRPYFQVLRDNGYQGPIEIEGKWEMDQVAKAFATIREQAAATAAS